MIPPTRILGARAVGAAAMARSVSTRACCAVLAALGKGPGMALQAAHDSPPMLWYRCGTRGSFRIRQEGGSAWAGGAPGRRKLTDRGHPSHVEPGSEEATHHLNAKVESSTFEVFQALYEREYAERMMVARLMNKLAGVVETKAQVRAERSSRTEEDAFKVKGPFAMGMQLPDIITHDVVVDMVTRMAKGKERIHLDSFKRIIDTASPILAKDPNIQIIENDQKVVVVGDLHGSIEDLLLCFQRSSWPGDDVHFIFNGDFVDRGDSGVEVLASILSFKILYPSTIHLNRGNHEDENVGRAYGFFDEIITKYGSRAAYDLVGSMYRNIPLCCVIRDKAFIVHAGIPSLPGATILHIGAIGRNAMKATVASQWDATDDVTGKRRQRPGGMRILEDMLWSDPIAPEEASVLDDFQEPNMMRGAGIIYGPKMVRDWLKSINCKTMVRSHQCVETGAIRLDCGEGFSCYTVFSASNYQGGINEAAFLVFDKGSDEPVIVRHRVTNPGPELAQRNLDALTSLIGANKRSLRRRFGELSEGRKDKEISLEEWNEIMRDVLRLELDFIKLKDELLDERCSLSKGGVEAVVNWEAFLDRYRISMQLGDVEKNVQNSGQAVCDNMQAVLSHRNMLGAVFRMIDVNGDGLLSRKEVASGVELLNGNLPAADQIDPADIFSLMDAKGTNHISVEEFTECWNVTTL